MAWHYPYHTILNKLVKQLILCLVSQSLILGIRDQLMGKYQKPFVNSLFHFAIWKSNIDFNPIGLTLTKIKLIVWLGLPDKKF